MDKRYKFYVTWKANNKKTTVYFQTELEMYKFLYLQDIKPICYGRYYE